MEKLFLPVSLALYIKRIILVIVLLIPCANTYAQGISNLWLMGYNSGSGGAFGGTKIDFYTGIADTSFIFRTMNFRQTCASISNASGNLLFYTNGIYIANANNDTMQNGDNLNPGWYATSFANSGLKLAQGDLILPIPQDTTRYYLFHETIEYLSSVSTYQSLELLYSMIDMTLDSGRGGVVFKNSTIISDTLLVGGVTACKHANGRDWWIITHRYDSDIYYTLLLTPYGITGPFTQHIGQYIHLYGGGQSSFSPDGKKFARYTFTDDVDIFDFDRCTGLLSNYVHIAINDSSAGDGLAISPNSRFLYVSSMNYVYQFDLADTNIASSQITVAVYDGFSDPSPGGVTNFYISHLANDGKIYINTGVSTKYLHVINNPDSAGLACNLTQHSFVLPTIDAFTIPNYPNFFLGADTLSICDSLHVGIENTVKHLENHLSVYVYSPAQKILVSAQGLAGKKYSLSIYDIRGREVFNSTGTVSNQYFSTEISSHSIAKGLYVISLQTEKEVLNGKFVVE